jgi:hypothetical protein
MEENIFVIITGKKQKQNIFSDNGFHFLIKTNITITITHLQQPF